MFRKPILMKCGHFANCIMRGVPYHNEKIHVAACQLCFNQLGTAIQPACNVADRQLRPEDFEPLPKIKMDYVSVLFGVAICITTIIALIASI